mmetsp:Transcript_2059/g.2110  ORF Transcript_2059/g.2110 Transcript_2059/m.2110 type:complete len:123 (-) Transcript_2059:495-863(-)
MFGTHLHHKMTTFLAIATPIVFALPDSITDGLIGQGFSFMLAANVSAHSWVGLNYVAVDYAPKISQALLGPARLLVAGLGLITFVGLSKIALFSPQGIIGVVKGVWRGPKQIESEKTLQPEE